MDRFDRVWDILSVVLSMVVFIPCYAVAFAVGVGRKAVKRGYDAGYGLLF